MRVLNPLGNALFTFVLLAAISALISMGVSKAQPNTEHVYYSENFRDNLARGWELEPGWVAENGALTGRGHHWARYRDVQWGYGRLVVRFKLTKLEGSIHANVLVSETGRYAVGLRRQAPGNRLRIDLFKQLWPDTFYKDLAAAEIADYDADMPSEVSIISEGGGIAVTLDGRPVFHYQDPSPLPPGTIAFETLDRSIAHVDDIIVIGAYPAGAGFYTASSKVELRIQTVFPTDFPIAGMLAQRLADLVHEHSRGEMRIDLFGSGELFPVKESLSAVQEGVVDAVFGFPALLFRNIPASQLLAGMPFGAGPRKHYDWLRRGGGRALYDEIHVAHGLKGIPCGLAGPEGFWSRRPLKEPGDFRDLNARSVGLAGKIFTKLDVLVEPVSPNAVARALQRGELGAAEISVPYVDSWFGVQGTAGYYYYYPSWHQSVTMIEVLLSERSWNRLSNHQQQMIEDLCHEITLESIGEDERHASRALQEIGARGVKVLKWPSRIQEAAQAAWESVADEEAREDPQFRRVYQAYHEILPPRLKTEVVKRPVEPLRPSAPKIESLDQPYVVTKGANIRERPDVRTKRIGSLRAGEKVTALGKVADKNWYLVALNGKELGYIYGALLTPETAVITEKALPDRRDRAGPTIHLDQKRIDTSSAQVEIAGMLEDVSAITKLSINGTLAYFSSADGTFRVTRRVEPGESKLRLEAEDKWGNRSKATVVIVRTTPAKGPAALPAKATAKPHPLTTYGKKYAVIIGISNYENLPNKPSKPGGLADLKYADQDARAFEVFLNDEKLSGGGWKIFTLYNEQATRKKVHYKLTEVLRTLARRGDLVYIYFSGHGRSHELWPEDIYLLTHDFDPQDYASGLSYEHIQTLINESPAEHIIAFVDACRSGVIGFGKADARGAFDQDVFGKRLRELGGKENKAIFSAGSADQISFEDDKVGHGVFTYFLLEGLRGKAPDNKKSPQTVDLGELERYVSEKVLDYTRTNPKLHTQIPKVQGTYSESFPVAIRSGD